MQHAWIQRYRFAQKKLLNRKTHHCGNDPSPYNNTRIYGAIDRGTYHGLGIQKNDKYIYSYKIRYNYQHETWGYQQRNYKVDKYQIAWTIGHIASGRGHSARRQTKRWQMPREDQPQTKNENMKRKTTTQTIQCYKSHGENPK